jgi:signal transduction histidine kinase
MLKHAGIRLLRISGFRLALQSAALSIFGALIVFGVIYHASEVTVRSELDSTVASEQADVMSDAHDDGSILKSVQVATAEGEGTFYALTGPDGNLLAGNLPVTPQAAKIWHGWHTTRRDCGIVLPTHVTAVRGLATKLDNGDTVYVAENASALHALDHLIANAFLAVFGTILALSVAGGLIAARSTLKQVEAISNTSRDIMNGDLSRRIVLSGTGDEFDRLSNNLNTMLERIQILMENIRQVSNDIAHDLRSPLARLREHLELSRKNSMEPATQLAFDEAIVQTDSALSIFAAMLRIAEIEAGARRRDFMYVNFSVLLCDLAETFETVAESESKSWSAKIASDLHINGDAELLTQMVVNVIENAIRHSPPGSHISMIAQPMNTGSVKVTISDNGFGIPPHERSRVLQRFVRLDTSRHTPGTGLGLALVAAVIELHSGEIHLENNEPGLKVVIHLHQTNEVSLC